MILTSTSYSFLALITGYLMTAMWNCNCKRLDCLKNPRTEVNGIYFKLKDANTGNDIVNYTGAIQQAPDSIKLIHLRTGYSFPLYVASSVNESLLFSQEYRPRANIVDSLLFKFGNAIPDTLIIYTGVVKGWRGDECPPVDDAGITKVMLRNQVLIETTTDNAIFTIRK